LHRLLALTGLVFTLPAEAATASDNKSPGDWAYECISTSASPQCRIEQIVSDPNRGRLADVILQHGQDGKLELQVTLPFGVALQAGIGLIFVGDIMRPLTMMAFRSCDEHGCFATLPVTDNLREALVGSARVQIVYSDSATGVPQALPVSMSGFATALRSLDPVPGH
jgi:invasion protein IalB